MDADSPSKPSFSPYLKWGTGLQVGLVTLVVLSVVVMINYLSRDTFWRFHLSTRSKNPLSPLTVKFVKSITNQVKVIVYYDKEEPLFGTVLDLLNEYHLVNPKIHIQVLDYLREPGAAQQLQTQYKWLASPTARNLVIFDCDGRTTWADGNALAKYTLERVPNKEDEMRRKIVAFEGERGFTSMLIQVINPIPLKAYFLQGHGEHQLTSGDELNGYLKFASLLVANNIKPEPLSLLGTNAVPGDCNLLVIAGLTTPLQDIELAKIDQYLAHGGRLLALFNVFSLKTGETGLEQILAKWGVKVSQNTVVDKDNTTTSQDIIVGIFGNHPIVNPLLQLRIQLLLPRSVGKDGSRPQAADAPHVEELAFSGPTSHLERDPPGTQGRSFPLMVAVEKGALKGVIAERGTTRIVVVGDSFFLANRPIDNVANRDLAGYMVNWLVDRPKLLEGLSPRPVAEYRLVMTKAQMQATKWVLLAGMPGAMLALGTMVWFRRRR